MAYTGRGHHKESDCTINQGHRSALARKGQMGKQKTRALLRWLPGKIDKPRICVFTLLESVCMWMKRWQSRTTGNVSIQTSSNYLVTSIDAAHTWALDDTDLLTTVQ